MKKLTAIAVSFAILSACSKKEKHTDIGANTGTQDTSMQYVLSFGDTSSYFTRQFADTTVSVPLSMVRIGGGWEPVKLYLATPSGRLWTDTTTIMPDLPSTFKIKVHPDIDGQIPVNVVAQSRSGKQQLFSFDVTVGENNDPCAPFFFWQYTFVSGCPEAVSGAFLHKTAVGKTILTMKGMDVRATVNCSEGTFEIPGTRRDERQRGGAPQLVVTGSGYFNDDSLVIEWVETDDDTYQVVHSCRSVFIKKPL